MAEIKEDENTGLDVLLRVVGTELNTARVQKLNEKTRRWETLSKLKVLRLYEETAKGAAYALVRTPDGLLVQITIDSKGDLPVILTEQPKLGEFEWPVDELDRAKAEVADYARQTGQDVALVKTAQGILKMVQAKGGKAVERKLGQRSNGYEVVTEYGYFDVDGKERIVTREEREYIPALPGFHWRKVAGFENRDTGEFEQERYFQEPDDPKGPRTVQEAIAQLVMSGKPEDLAKAREYQKFLNEPTVYQEWQKAQAEIQRQDALKAQETQEKQWQKSFDQKQYEFEISYTQSEDERNRVQARWEAEFGDTARQWRTQLENRQYEFGTEMGQRQWEQGQAAQREALKLGIDISRSPADWWALENLRYGAQPNRPYTGEDVAPRSWVSDWLKFAQQPMPPLAAPKQAEVPQLIAPTRPIPPIFGQGPGMSNAAILALQEKQKAETARLAAETAAAEKAAAEKAAATKAAPQPPVPGAPQLPLPGAPLPAVPGSQGSPLFATEAEAKAWRVAQQPTPPLVAPRPPDALASQEEIAALNKLWGIAPPPAPPLNRHFREDEEMPLFDSPAEAPYPLPATRFMAKKAGETAIINEREIPAFLDSGFKVTQKVNLYDPPSWLSVGSTQPPLARLPQMGVRQALLGQPVSRPRSWSTLGAPTAPSAQSWGRLPWEGQQMVQSEVERIGVPWQSYANEMASLWPSWGSQDRFRRAPNLLGGGRI